MKKLLCIYILVLFGLQAELARAQGQASSRATASMSAEVIYTATAQAQSQLNFGHCAPGPAGGQVQISPEGTVNTEGSVVMISNAQTPARFYITGIQDKAFSISLSDGPTVLNHNGSTNTMLVHGWDSTPAPDETWKLDGGALGVNVGAVLDINNMNDNPVGLYTGFYSIIFNYH